MRGSSLQMPVLKWVCPATREFVWHSAAWRPSHMCSPAQHKPGCTQITWCVDHCLLDVQWSSYQDPYRWRCCSEADMDKVGPHHPHLPGLCTQWLGWRRREAAHQSVVKPRKDISRNPHLGVWRSWQWQGTVSKDLPRVSHAGSNPHAFCNVNGMRGEQWTSTIFALARLL